MKGHHLLSSRARGRGGAGPLVSNYMVSSCENCKKERSRGPGPMGQQQGVWAKGPATHHDGV